MIGDCALIGYIPKHRDKCECSPCRNSPWYASDISRICGWINLLKKLEFKTTADVVAIYLIATRQHRLLSPFLDFMVESECSYRDITTPEWGGMAKISMTGTNVLDPREIDGKRYEQISNALSFPPELYKMANRYMLYRINSFIDALVYTVVEGNGCLGTGWGLRVGMKLPKRIINALDKFTPTATSVNTVVSHVKALYASLMPQVTCADDCCYSVRKYDKYPSLKWDRSTYSSDNRREENKVEWEAIGTRFISQYTKLGKIVTSIASDLRSSVSYEPTTLTMDTKEAFCCLLEMMMYITCCTKCYSGTSGMHLPCIDDANKFFFQDKVEDNGAIKDNFKFAMNVSSESELQDIYAIRGITPAAAICVGDIITTGRRRSCYGWLSERLAKFFERYNPNPYGEVLTFLLGEYNYQLQNIGYGERVKSELIGGPNR